MRTFTVTLVYLTVALIGSRPLDAEPIQWIGNGHYYDLVANQGGGVILWTQAKLAAEALTFGGQPGHLATITNTAENDFVTSTFASSWDAA